MRARTSGFGNARMMTAGITYGAAWSVLVLYATEFVLGAHAFIWGTTSRTVRMAAVA